MPRGPHITAGQFKGLPLRIPTHIRATESKVRQALFNILGASLEEARVLDGFAGSGALGLEALSRGAAFVTFVESDAEAVCCIQDNLHRLGLEVSREQWRLVHLDVPRGMQQIAKIEAPFDLVLLDPPYRTDDGKKALNAVIDCAILAPTGILVIEHDRRTVPPVSVGFLLQDKRHRYGDTVLSFYRVR